MKDSSAFPEVAAVRAMTGQILALASGRTERSATVTGKVEHQHLDRLDALT